MGRTDLLEDTPRMVEAEAEDIRTFPRTALVELRFEAEEAADAEAERRSLRRLSTRPLVELAERVSLPEAEAEQPEPLVLSRLQELREPMEIRRSVELAEVEEAEPSAQIRPAQSVELAEQEEEAAEEAESVLTSMLEAMVELAELA